MHPHYLTILDKVKKAGALIHINTNGSLLDEEHIYRLMDMHLDSIKFSFQGADEGTYNEMREGGDYFKLLNVVRQFYKIRGDRDYPYIQISTTLTGETADQIDNFKNDIENYCDYYNVGYTKLNHLNVETMNISEEEKIKIRRLQRNEANNHKYTKVCNAARIYREAIVNQQYGKIKCCSNCYEIIPLTE